METVRFKNVIGRRLLVYILVFSFVITAFSSGYQLYEGYQSDLAALEEQIDTIKLSQLKRMSEAIRHMDNNQAEVHLNGILQLLFVEFVSLKDLTESTDPADRLQVELGEIKSNHGKTHTFQLFDPAGEMREPAAELKIVVSHDGIISRLRQRVIVILLTQSIKTFLVSFFILFSVHYLITRHLKHLASLSQSFELEEDDSVRHPEKKKSATRDELDIVFDSFNAMREKIKITYRELRYANKELVSTDKLKDRFLIDASRELKNPISGMVAIAETLMKRRKEILSNEDVFDLYLIINSGRRLSHLIDDSLDYTRLKNKKIILNKKPVDMKAIADVVLSSSQVLVRDEGLKLLNLLPDDLPSVMADDLRMQQVLFNIISNAVKHTKRGEIKVMAKVSRGYLVIIVKDTGTGFTEETLTSAFSYFRPLDGDNTQPLPKIGMGLSVAKQMVELHGGYISINSKEGAGTEVVFSIPLEETTVKEWDSHKGSFVEQELLVDGPDTGHNIIEPRVQDLELQSSIRILVVDDEPLERRVIKNYLTEENYDVFLVGSGEEALKTIEDARPDLVIVDALMPQMSGIEVCAQIRETYSNKELPIIMLTTRDFSRGVPFENSIKANDYLEKPVYKHELLARIQSQIQIKQANQRIASILQFSRQLNAVRDINSLLSLFFDHIQENIQSTFAVLMRGDEVIRQSGEPVSTDYLQQQLLSGLSVREEYTPEKVAGKNPGFVIYTGLKGFEGYSILVFRNRSNGSFSDTTVKYLENIANEIYEIRSNIHKITESGIPRDAILTIKKMMNRITHIKSASPFCEITLDGIDDTVEVPITMQEIELYFGDSSLFRVHRQYFVIPKKAWGIRKKNPKDYEMVFGKTVVPIGRTYLKMLRAKHSYLFDK